MAKIWTAVKSWVDGVPLPASDLQTYVSDNVDYLYPPIKVQGGQTTYPYYWTGGVQSVDLDGSANFTVTFSTAFTHAIVFGHVQAASGGSPFAVTVGSLNVGSIDCHATTLEGTDVTSVTLSVVFNALGY